MLPTISGDLGISATQTGVALTVLTALSAMMHFPGGRLADELSRKTVLVGTILAWLAGLALLVLTVNYAMLLSGFMLVGM